MHKFILFGNPVGGKILPTSKLFADFSGGVHKFGLANITALLKIFHRSNAVKFIAIILYQLLLQIFNVFSLLYFLN